MRKKKPEPDNAREQVEAICGMVADGKTIRAIAEELGASAAGVMRLIALRPEYSEQYARAREAAADLFESDIIEAAMTVDASTASAMKVRIDALKWVAGRRAPKRYGVTPASELEEELARLQAEKLRRDIASGADADQATPVSVTIEVRDARNDER